MTLRAFLIGLAAVALIAGITPYNDFDRGSTFFTGNHFPAGPLVILLTLTIVANIALKLIRRSWAMRQSELMLIWCMMVVSCTVPASGLMRYAFSITASPAYYAARPDLPWEEHVLKNVPRDLVLTKDPKSAAAKKFFDGTPSGEDMHIPWSRWARPMVSWGVFTLLFYMATFCISGMLRKQWVDAERLIFPLARVPLDLTEGAGKPAFLPAVMRSKAFLIGVIVTLVFAFMRAAPVLLTGADVGWRPEFRIQEVLWGTPLQSLGMGNGSFYPIAIGFAFLVPSDISLSVWFFFIYTRLENQIGFWIGKPVVSGTWGPFHSWQQAGAYIVVVLMMLWGARRPSC